MERNELILMQEDETKLCSENDSGHADHHGHVLLLPADPLLPGSTSGLISVVIHTTIMLLILDQKKEIHYWTCAVIFQGDILPNPAVPNQLHRAASDSPGPEGQEREERIDSQVYTSTTFLVMTTVCEL